ncbi:hypothetical protein BDQ12DRAFT_687343 [Crucibulum laeve]|uniref:F-box domain-containing protein n=1 Tax=Crucibulum laeve TaxID=68775 RepID=A0A5C3LTM3_9AGAR|nr:hypothetical protein BDQ12DRAFT_687343 [Crucibulum laeve]
MDSLSFDVKDLILSLIPTREELLPLAFASRSWYSLIVPRHTEYRKLHLSFAHPEVWAHLAERADLASNIREVRLGKWNPQAEKEIYSKTVVSVDCYEDGDVSQALRNMTNLLEFVWISPWLPFQATGKDPYAPIFQALQESRTLKKLSIHHEREPEDDEVPLSGQTIQPLYLKLASRASRFPLWSVANLTSLTLFGNWATPHSDAITSMLFLSLCLEELSIFVNEVDCPGFTSCHFPHLRKLYTVRIRKESIANISTANLDAPMLAFLAAHPTIEDLRWYPLLHDHYGLSSGMLPKLRRIESHHGFILALLSVATSGTRTLESLSKIFLRADTFEYLENVDPTSLRELEVSFCGDNRLLPRVAAMFPNITRLTVQGVHYSPIPDTFEEFIPFLASFTSLETLWDASMWEIFNWSKQADKDLLINKVARACPRLKELYYCDRLFTESLRIRLTLIRSAREDTVKYKLEQGAGGEE